MAERHEKGSELAIEGGISPHSQLTQFPLGHGQWVDLRTTWG